MIEMTTELLPSVALVGKQGSGKTTLADILVRDNYYVKHSWASNVRHVFELAYETITPANYASIKARTYETTVITPEGNRMIALRTGGELLQLIGAEAIREQVDQDFWVKSGIRSLMGKKIVSDDTRYLNEAEALRGRGWVIVRITAPVEIRKARLGGAFRPENHSSETEQENIVEDYVLNNDEQRDIDEVALELITYLRSVDNSFMAQTQRALSDSLF